MRDQPAPDDAVRIDRCDTEAALVGAAALFNAYRHHYDERRDDERALGWLTGMVGSGALVAWTASLAAEPGVPVGLATSHAVPASLRMGEFWQLRDLFVLPAARGHGVATALVGAVAQAARRAGAVRLSLITESDNAAALGLYRRLGFATVDGLRTLSLGLSTPPTT